MWMILLQPTRNQKVLNELKEQLKEEYGEMSATLRDDQTYLGMDISFRQDSKTAAINMKG